MTVPPVIGVLCDMDGTLVDTEPYWEDAKIRVARDHGIPFTSDDARRLVGGSMLVTARYMHEKGVPLPTEALIHELVDDVVQQLGRHIPWLPGAQQFLQRLADARIPACLVTQAYSGVANVIAAHAPKGALQHVVAGDAIARPKPDPDPYLTAMDRLNLPASVCLAIEDTPAGVASARAAGVPVLVVSGIVPVPEDPSLSRADDLSEVTIDLLRRIIGGEVIDLRHV